MSLRRAPGKTAADGRAPEGRGQAHRTERGRRVAGVLPPAGCWPSALPSPSPSPAARARTTTAARTAAPARRRAFERIGTGDLARRVTGLQAHLKAQPKDDAGLGDAGRRLCRAGPDQAAIRPLSAGGPRSQRSLTLSRDNDRRSRVVPRSRRPGTTSATRCGRGGALKVTRTASGRCRPGSTPWSNSAATRGVEAPTRPTPAAPASPSSPATPTYGAARRRHQDARRVLEQAL